MKPVKSKAPKSAPKAAKPASKAKKAEPTLKQMMLQLDENQQVLLANQALLEKRMGAINNVVATHSNQIVTLEKVSRETYGRVAKLEAKVFPPDPTPDDWKAAEVTRQTAYEQQFEQWRKGFRDWVTSVLATGAKIPASIPREYFEKAFGMDWETQVPGAKAGNTPPEAPKFAGGCDWGAGESQSVRRDFFGYQRQAPTYSWSEREEAQREANQQHRQAQERSRAYRTSRNPHAREELNRAVKRYHFKSNMPYEDVWNMLYDLVTVGLGYDPRREAVPTEAPIDVLDYRGDLVLARQLLWPLLSRAEGQL